MKNCIKIGIGAIALIVFAVFGCKGFFDQAPQPKNNAKKSMIQKGEGRFYTRGGSKLSKKSQNTYSRVIYIGEPVTGLLD